MDDPAARPAGPAGWSPRRRARFLRTVLLAALVLLVVLAWLVHHAHAGTSARRGTSAPAARSQSPSPTPSPSATGLVDEARGRRHGVVGDISTTLPQKGTGTFTVLPGRSGPASQPGRVVRYTIEVEGGLGLDDDYFARTVATTLLDPRGWQTRDHMRWVSVSPQEAAAGAPVDVRVTLASQRTVDAYCAPLDTSGGVSCFNRGRAMLNAERWTTGAYTYGRDLSTYRTYQIDHEVGHGLGHGHVGCPAPGRRAPVMLQQTKTLQGCVPWPFPTGA